MLLIMAELTAEPHHNSDEECLASSTCRHWRTRRSTCQQNDCTHTHYAL